MKRKNVFCSCHVIMNPKFHNAKCTVMYNAAKLHRFSSLIKKKKCHYHVKLKLLWKYLVPGKIKLQKILKWRKWSLSSKSFWLGKWTGSCIALCYSSTQSALVFRSFTHLKTHLYSSELDTYKFLPLKKIYIYFHALLFKVSYVYEDKEQGTTFICIYNCASLVQRIKFIMNMHLYLFITQ